MNAEDIDEWLDSWIEDNYERFEDPNQAVSLCLKDASATGIAEADVVDAAGGDLAAHLIAESMAIAEARED
ncbi:hypothetical protein [Kozakia baliensis]|uniref:Uncharacterized protein n=1 Tax=Kozakia baliensis TaxID=153496 RepID=A0A1D8UUL6_9PROT|nr:hypothetical protein [Kozakia baliensis]AOX17342.1 hypothetical protein A0U89_09575 [Kozakia baliensis]GBR30148.1 hypothetical protein AA0488_1908 [Kozakia baliensis NRIC 0488]GEL63218.1 hypothetical protein KBA01_05040 [Kozakia baliensis]